MTSIEYTAASSDEAIQKGLDALNVSREDVDIEIISEARRGFLGIGASPAKVRMTIKDEGLRTSMRNTEKAAEAAKAEAAEAAKAEAAMKAAKAEADAKAAKAEAAMKAAKAEQPKAEAPAPVEKPARQPKPRSERSEQRPRPEGKPRSNDSRANEKSKGEARPRPEQKAAPKTAVPVPPAETPSGMPEGTTASAPAEVLTEETVQVAANVVRDLMEKMHVNATIESKITESTEDKNAQVILVNIQGDDLSYLIGRHSEVLHSLQYITSLIVGREVGHWVPLVIDVQGYRERRERQLRQMALRMAEQVVKTGRRVSMEPMPATERRIIHLALRDNHDITTESIGEEPNRKVVILPKEHKK